MIITLFGGPLDGKVIEIFEYSSKLKFPVRRKDIRYYAKEAEPLTVYYELTYVFFERYNDSCIYFYEEPE